MRVSVIPGDGDITVALGSWLRRPVFALPLRIVPGIVRRTHRIARIIPVVHRHAQGTSTCRLLRLAV